MLMTRLLERVVQTGDLTMIDAQGRAHRFGDGTAPAMTVRVDDPLFPWKLLLWPDLALGEAYMDGKLVIEDASLYDFLDLLGRNIETSGIESFQRYLNFFHFLFRHFPLNTRERARKNAAHHYDLTLELYKLFLDSDYQYSCAYFATQSDSLDSAQRQKRRHIAAKLLLDPGMRVLDIGCGWGGLCLYLADRFDVRAVGITLSEEQLKVSRTRASAAGLEERARFFLRDYRDEVGIYDRIVSIGMFEHVGVGQYERFFRNLRELLAENGIALLHTICHWDVSSPPGRWARKYIFPGGYVPALSEVVPAIERAGLVITDIEVLRLHYASTLRCWRERFLANREKVQALYDERFCRMWEFYLAGAEISLPLLETVRSSDTIVETAGRGPADAGLHVRGRASVGSGGGCRNAEIFTGKNATIRRAVGRVGRFVEPSRLR